MKDIDLVVVAAIIACLITIWARTCFGADELRYNGFEDSWSYESASSELAYNGFNDSYEWRRE